MEGWVGLVDWPIEDSLPLSDHLPSHTPGTGQEKSIQSIHLSETGILTNEQCWQQTIRNGQDVSWPLHMRPVLPKSVANRAATPILKFNPRGSEMEPLTPGDPGLPRG